MSDPNQPEADRPSSDDGAVRSPRHPLAGELRALQRVVNTVRLYGLEHEHAREQTREMVQRMSPLLDELGGVDLDISYEAITFEGDVVVSEPEPGGIVDELYRDGIRRITLRTGIEVDEMLELLAILGTNFSLPEYQEDTLQGLLWAANLPHIGYEAIRGIEEAIEDSADAARGENLDFEAICEQIVAAGPMGIGLAGDPILKGLMDPEREVDLPTAPDLPPEDGELAGGGGVSDEPQTAAPRLASDDHSVAGALSRMADADPGASNWRRLASLDTVDFVEGKRTALDVSADELLVLWDEADMDTFAGLLDRTVAILVHTAVAGEAGIDVDRAAPLIEGCLDHASAEGLIQRYTTTIEKMLALQQSRPSTPEGNAAFGLLTRLLRTDRILGFASRLDRDDPQVAKALQTVLELGGRDTQMAFLDALGDISEPNHRRFLVERVVQVLGDDASVLTQQIRRLDERRLRVRLEALASMGSMSAHDQLSALLGHANPAVRRAVVELLPSDYLRHIWKRVMPMLASDHDLDVRCAVIRRAEAEELPALPGVLARMTTADSFHKRELKEKDLALSVFARMAGAQAVEILTKMLNARVGLASPRQAETRRLAAMALAATGTIEARRALAKAAKAWEPGQRKAAQEALKAFGGAGS